MWPSFIRKEFITAIIKPAGAIANHGWLILADILVPWLAGAYLYFPATRLEASLDNM